ncbi:MULTISPECIES: 50S ribosomal protein L18 [Helicobacter]|uniref:Large ribosomal subunit protein uL18 n=1 Tax=Helicobacter ibis TaxID=2962633 RepID=A0ABT4VBX2_9HELI|nr:MULTISPECIES: 50S ribosomal protein L18 [Helicobacter]MDA3966984.1 50S ribosomal protein L18 [Helicobacter sp. WB40]MDA3968210.1 50S ribosomal protein L18 [Helicobacter ibis]
MTSKIIKRKRSLRIKRKLRIRSRIHGDSITPRLSIFRSNRYFYAQAIDDVNGVTLASVDGKKMGLKNNKDDVKKIASSLADSLKKAKIEKVIFDRNGYLYHGVVASFADSLRENGISL